MQLSQNKVLSSEFPNNSELSGVLDFHLSAGKDLSVGRNEAQGRVPETLVKRNMNAIGLKINADMGR
jgi:hypothetical protein